jgi:hypothetical protein
MARSKINKRELEILRKKIELLMKANFSWSNSYKKYNLEKSADAALISFIEWANIGVEDPENISLIETSKNEFLQNFAILMHEIEKIVMSSLWEATLQNSLGKLIKKITSELDITTSKNEEEYFA